METNSDYNPLFIAKERAIKPPPMLPVAGATNSPQIDSKVVFKAKKLNDEELLALAKEKLSEALQAVDASERPEQARKLAAEVWDRLLGKPAQSITANINSTMAVLVANVRPNPDLVERIKRDLLAGVVTLDN